MPIDPITIGLFALIAIMIFFMFRNSRKRKQEAEKLQERMVPGVEVMTQHGIYGTLISIDDDANEAIVETTPGTRLRLHRQTLARVVEPELETSDEEAADEGAESTDTDADGAPAGEPEFGERSDEAEPKSPRKKTSE